MALAVGLFSGGLDSILAVCVLKEQNIHIEAVAFVTPFFGPENAQQAAKMLNIPIHIVDITDVHLQMLERPRHGYGKGMNPCVDCHALMFREAGKLMLQWRADFLFSGEVLGERPMSQNKQSLRIVARDSGFEEYIIRPLSAQLLPITKPEREGKVDRERLLDIQGRSRKRQMELAHYYGIAAFPEPAGGCRLTEPNFSRRLKDLMRHHRNFSVRDIELLKIGRHLRLTETIKCVVGRNEADNAKIVELLEPSDILLTPEKVSGPALLIPLAASNTPIAQDALQRAASICARYCKKQAGAPVEITGYINQKTHKIIALPCSDQETAQLMI